MKKNEIKEESYLSYATIVKCASCLFIFHQRNIHKTYLLSIHKKHVSIVFFLLFTLSLSVTITARKQCACS